MNDTIVYNVNLVSPRRYGDIIKRQFDRLYEEGEQSGTVMCIPLHAYLIGQPHRIGPFEEALRHIASDGRAWLATAARRMTAAVSSAGSAGAPAAGASDPAQLLPRLPSPFSPAVARLHRL